jgi:hypothetical protein
VGLLPASPEGLTPRASTTGQRLVPTPFAAQGRVLRLLPFAFRLSQHPGALPFCPLGTCATQGCFGLDGTPLGPARQVAGRGGGEVGGSEGGGRPGPPP